MDGVDLDLYRGRSLGVIGESGSGKSVTATSLVGLLPKPGARIVRGEIWFEGRNMVTNTDAEWARYRGKHIAMMLQDPLSALNPVLTIGDQLREPLRLHQNLRGRALEERAIDLLSMMQIPAVEDRLNSYPHQFSGGMRQRVVAAIALAGEPEVLVADEPTTALDATVQAGFIRLLKEIQLRTGVAMLFITHDFRIVGEICDDVAVMYAGRVVETASTRSIYTVPSHPYTKALLRAVPDLRVGKGSDRLVAIPGSPPSIYGQPSGCRFHPRCWLYERLGNPDECRTISPPMIRTGADGHARCHFADNARTEVL